MLGNLRDRVVLKPYIIDGKVDYEKLEKHGQVEEWLAQLQSIDPVELDEDDIMAFWMNAYNMIVLKSVLDKLRDNPDWEGVTSLWRKFKFFIWNRYEIGNRKVSLYALENKILRKEFDDARIHFGLNCASNSCPYLPSQLFNGDTLDEELEELTSDFINQQQGVIVRGDEIHVSEIFEMYMKDFGGESGIIKFVRKYYDGEDFPQSPKLRYQDYDWGINRN